MVLVFGFSVRFSIGFQADFSLCLAATDCIITNKNNKMKDLDIKRKTFQRKFSLRPFRPDFEFELLLLGADGSGKSTFIRQMQVRPCHVVVTS